MAGKTLQSTIEIAGTLSPSLQQAIKQAVDRLEEMSQETLESAGAAAKLAAEISTQESVLKNLQRGYEDYIVSGSESTDEALKLADTIQDLSNELNENRGALEAAHEAAQKLAGGQQETADAYSKLQKQIGEQEAELATLRRSYANVALEQGETSAEARQLASPDQPTFRRSEREPAEAKCCRTGSGSTGQLSGGRRAGRGKAPAKATQC